ncbi:hypothetical protein ACWF9G_08910 [Nocardia sp. NPDC055029]
MVDLRVDQTLNAVAQTVEDAGGNSSVLALSSTAVGIGTTSPEALLQVAGNVRLEKNGSPKLGIRSRGNGTQHYSLRATNDADAAGGRRFVIRNESEQRDDLILDNAGNIQTPGDVRLEKNGSPKLGIRSRGNGTQHYSLRATNDADAVGGRRFVIRNESEQRDDLILDNAGDVRLAGDLQLDRRLAIQPRGLGVQNYSLRATDLADAAGASCFVIRNESEQRDDLVLDSAGNIHIAGDIILQNADCAEDFQAEDPGASEPGTIMVVGDDLKLRVSDAPYDTCVAGVVAGAGDLRPGIVLGRGTAATAGVPIALIGRIMCKVDADTGPIRVGDLLTSSAVPGHAMRAADPQRAFGAVIGKALGTLTSGRGMIPMLVALQ